MSRCCALRYTCSHSDVWPQLLCINILYELEQQTSCARCDRIAFGGAVPVILCTFHVKRAWLNFLLKKVRLVSSAAQH